MKRSTAVVLIFSSLAIVAAVLLWRTPSAPVRDQVATPEAEAAPESPDLPAVSAPADTSGTLPRGTGVSPVISSTLEDLPLDEPFLTRFETITSTAISNYLERHAAAQALGSNLSEHEIHALYRFLLAAPPDGDLLRRQDRALKNDVINRLRVQDEAPPGLAELLAAMFDNPEQDETVRDYALQQMRAWHEDAPSEDRPLILETLARGLEETESSIAATALLALRQFEQSSTGILPAVPISATESALRILHNETAADLSRVTAMQVAAESSPAEVFDTAAQWALDSGLGYPRRLSAIAALGASGSPEAAAVLARVEALEDPYFQSALQTAYRKLRQAGIEAEFTPSR